MWKLLLVTVYCGRTINGNSEPYLNGGVSSVVADFPDRESADAAYVRLLEAAQGGVIVVMPFRLWAIADDDIHSPFDIPAPAR